MYIEIASNVIDKAEKVDLRAIEVLKKLAISIRYGKHFVLASLKDIDRILKIQELGDFEKKAYEFVRRKFSSIGGVKEWMRIQAVVTYAENTRIEGSLISPIKRIYINPEISPSFEYYEETHLLVENLLDAKFYDYVVRYFQRHNKPRCTDYLFYALMGGGNTADKVVEYENELKQHFLLAIVDSDKKSGIQVSVGDTAKGVRSECSKTEFNSDYYIMENVAEIENLIPFSWIQNEPNFKSHEIIQKQMTFDMSFFDMKKGLRAKILKNNDDLIYWKEKLENKLPNSVWCNIQQKDDDEVILTGFGDNIMKQVFKSPQSSLDFELTESQKKEWDNIGGLILAWSCCYSKRALYS